MESYKDIAQTPETGIADSNAEQGYLRPIVNAGVVFSRLVFSLFAILTSAYCLLAYIPFTYQWVISFNLVGWLPAFVRFHPLLFMLALGTVAATLTGDLKHKETQRLTAGFLVVHALIGIALLMYPVLPRLQNDEMSFVWAIVWLFPPLWIVAIDFTRSFKEIRWDAPSKNYERFLAAASLAALLLSVINTSLVFLRANFGDLASFTLSERLVAVGWSFASHLFLFAVLLLALVTISFLSIKSRGGAKTEFLLCHILGGVVLAFVIRKVVMPAIAFNGPLAIVYSCAASCLITSIAMCLRLKLQQNSREPINDGIALSL